MTNSLCILFQSVRCASSILKLSKNGIKKSQPWELHDYSFIRSTSAKLSFYVLLTFKKTPTTHISALPLHTPHPSAAVQLEHIKGLEAKSNVDPTLLHPF